MEKNCYPFENEPLPYSFDALEPFIDEKTMFLHHNRHLQTYINNLNTALKKNCFLQNMSLTQILRRSSIIPNNQRTEIMNNAGGVYNHRFFFNMMSPSSIKTPFGNLEKAIISCFNSFEQFEEKFRAAAMSVFGSGYAWLVLDKGRLRIITTANQNTPLQLGVAPLLCIDVWEHAYYLKHYNMRADYIKDWFNVVDWNKAEALYKTYKNMKPQT